MLALGGYRSHTDEMSTFEIGGAAALDQFAPAVAAALLRVQSARPAGLYDEVLDSPGVVALADQFRADVSLIDEQLRAGFAAATGERQFEAAQMLWVADMTGRVQSVLDGLFGTSTWAVVPRRVPVADMWARIESFMATVARLDALDPTVTELVRLRGARQHGCRLCMSRRSVAAIELGAGEATFDAVDRYADSDLPDATKAALALTDATIWTPYAVPEQVRTYVHRHLSPAQTVEVVLDVARNATNKIAVALGADAATVTDGVELFVTDDDGSLTFV